LIASNPDRNSGKEGRFMPGGGVIGKCVETTSGTKATVIGKPNANAFDIIRKDHGLENESLDKFIMVGDNPETDIKLGNNC